MFHIQGRFASLLDVPHVGFDVSDVESLDERRLASIFEAADLVQLRRREFKEHWTSRWRVLKSGTPSLTLANRIRQDMHTVAAAVVGVQSTVPAIAMALGLRVPDTLKEVTRLEILARHLARAVGIPRSWLQEGVAKRLRSIAEREADLQRTRSQLIERLSGTFGSPVPNWDYAALAEQLCVTPAEKRSLRRALGEGWAERLVRRQDAASPALQQLKIAFTRLKSVGTEVAEFLRLETASA